MPVSMSHAPFDRKIPIPFIDECHEINFVPSLNGRFKVFLLLLTKTCVGHRHQKPAKLWHLFIQRSWEPFRRRANYDNFSFKEVESRLEGGQEDISGKTAATCLLPKKPGGGRKRATSDDAAQSEAEGGQRGEKPPTRFFELLWLFGPRFLANACLAAKICFCLTLTSFNNCGYFFYDHLVWWSVAICSRRQSGGKSAKDFFQLADVCLAAKTCFC